MRDSRGRSAPPRRLDQLLTDFQAEIAPPTSLAAVQLAWGELVGERIAAVTEVTGEREGVITVQCSSAVWAQELELMAPRILKRLEEQLDNLAPQKLRFRGPG